jgi:hypothetical protein
MWRINIFDRKGQNTAEYAILIALVIAAAVAMQTYVKRGMQGRVHDASDRFYDNLTGDSNWSTISGTSASTIANKQFEPTKFSSLSTRNTLQDDQKLDMAQGGTLTRASTERNIQAAGDYQKHEYK